MIKIAFFDFDFTLYSHNTHCVPESAIQALEQLQQKGIRTFLATGRSQAEINNFDIRRVLLTGRIISNGQLAFVEEDKKVYDDPMKGIIKQTVLQEYKSKRFPISVATQDNFYINKMDEEAYQSIQNCGAPIPIVKEELDMDIYLATFYTKNKQEEEDVHALPGAKFSWRDGTIDIVNEEACKSRGIRGVLHYYGFQEEEGIYFGDGDNDIDMMQLCGTTVCMGNGTENAKKHASYITDDIDQDGIYNACKHFHLI